MLLRNVSIRDLKINKTLRINKLVTIRWSGQKISSNRTKRGNLLL